MMEEKTKQGYIRFCNELERLLNDDRFPLENNDTIRFLEAMHAWLKDTDGGSGYFEKSNCDGIMWADLIKLVKAACMYE